MSVWRELRRLRNQELADKVSPVFGELHRAAHAGDWQGYITLQGGPFVSRAKLALRTWYQYKNEPTSYGQYRKAIKGLVMPVSSIPRVETRLHSYRIVKIKPKSSDRVDSGFDLQGASVPSWTRVNNYTEYEKCTNLRFSSPHEDEAEQYEIVQITRYQRKRLHQHLINYNLKRKMSPADKYELLANAITASECNESEKASAHSYMKLAFTLRQNENMKSKEKLK
ncbi:hypothetical protein [Enterobacter cloacae]|uniref:Putative replication endonuclease from prophage-like region n=1 Tax=Enterobacter cloacae TaxID=550 RepID=A0A144THA3_ENTCL|nr:hypothetical protein [Enterobacter cloacae]CZW30486.1 putative replication endonuclease from prophage-like region [Enterobacter cloacae]SAH61611.1 putative replication endonuclease from prophage-like region [Enterobacter cloacae]